jgi:hypothetical protein
MLKKLFNFFQYFSVILAFVCSVWFIFIMGDYNKMDKNDLPFFVIQQGKLSQKQIADLTKFSDAKNIWVINDKEDFNRATELLKQSADAISYANQVGRLDLISMLLGVVAIIFGLAGIIGFLHIETMVKAQIDQTIKKEFEEGGLGNETVREEAKKSFDKMSSRPMDPSLGEEGDGDDEAEAHYEELFKKIRDEI